jgi:hypothetical protein
MVTIDYIFDTFQITDEEYTELDRKFGDLCHFVAWDLKRKNSKNNVTDDQEDIAQNMRWAISRAGVYTKRQKYLEDSMEAAKEHVKDNFSKEILEELQHLWNNRTRHGANKQKFGEHQEKILEKLVLAYVPNHLRPDKRRKLQIDKKFVKYCKAIVWNESKNLGKKITRDRRVRFGQVSLSEWSFLGGRDL